MQAFTTHKGLVLPLDRENVDTDLIIPKQFMKSVRRTGFGAHLFDELRYLDHGEPGMNAENRPQNPDFILNQARYQQASILLGRRNFGCGSSREHAPWALQQYGFKALIAPSYADIFSNNCLKNGLLPIVLPEPVIDQLFEAVTRTSGYALTVDLVQQQVLAPDAATWTFEIDAYSKEALLQGLDEIGQTLTHADEIRAFEARHFSRHPWLRTQGDR
ncbi:3-isopropylmalate dehydratase small subunit [Castellaniella sp.]|uniref:3-isopropylmalate dehydratase small subunit n=1 Tax=Castellaniella sp. TaxID=1955812 RepID=UPI003C725F94